MNSKPDQISAETFKLIESHAERLGISPDEFLRDLLMANEREIALGPDAADDEFERDMTAFAEGTEDLPSYDGTYSRDDIYLGHS